MAAQVIERVITVMIRIIFETVHAIIALMLPVGPFRPVILFGLKDPKKISRAPETGQS
jgi:hypothetical protein